MSSTNRGAERLDADNYPTPAWAVRRLLEGFPELPPGAWVEPCVGEGAIVRAVLDSPAAPHMMFAHGFDIRDVREAATAAGCKSFRVGDASDPGLYNRLDAVGAITNPPYSKALPIARTLVSRFDCVALLLRLNFLGSGTRDGRSAWLRKNPPDVGVLPNRPSFIASVRCTGVAVGAARRSCEFRAMIPLDEEWPRQCPECGGKTARTTSDSSEYAWFVWPKGSRKYGRVFLLGDTPDAERKIT